MSFLDDILGADEVQLESILDKVSLRAPPPKGFEGFFNTRTPQEVVAQSRSPDQMLAQQIAANSPLKYSPESLQKNPSGGISGDALGSLGKMFAGDTSAPPAPHFAPLPGTGPRGGQVSPVPVTGGAGSKVDPLTALAERVMRGVVR